MVMDRTGKSNEHVINWFNFCRECAQLFWKLEKKRQNSQNPFQIDEVHFTDWMKYNRSRLLTGNVPPSLDNLEAVVTNNRNHGKRVDGPWAFCLKNGNGCRYFYVNRCYWKIFLLIIEHECETGSEVHSNNWSAYKFCQRQ